MDGSTVRCGLAELALGVAEVPEHPDASKAAATTMRHWRLTFA